MNVNTAPLGKFCVVEWIQGRKAGRRETVSRDLVQLQPERGSGACKVRSPFTDSNQYSPAVLHFHNDDFEIISMWLLLSRNTSEKNAVVHSDKASRKRQRQLSPPAVQRVGKGHTGHGGPRDSTDMPRYIVVQADVSLRKQYACVPRSWIMPRTSTSLPFGASCFAAWPADMEKLGPWARLGCSPSPDWGLRRVICVYGTDNYDAGQDWIRTMTNDQPIFSGDPRLAKVPRIYNSSRRFTGHQSTTAPLPSISAVVNELHELSVCHDTNACPSFLPAPYDTEEFRKLITTYNCIPKPLRPATAVPDHTVAPTPVMGSLANLPYVQPLRSTSLRANSSSAAMKSPKTTSFSTSARVMVHNAPSTHASEIRRLQKPSVPISLPLSNLAPATSMPSFGLTSAPTPLPLSNLAPATSMPSFRLTLAPTPLPLSNLAPATSMPSFGLISAPTPLPLSNLAPAIPSFGSTSAPTPLPLSNLAPATSIPSFGSTSAPTPLPLSNLAPATSIPSFGSTSASTPLPLSNLAPAIPSFGSTSAPTPLPLSNLAPATSIPPFGSTSASTPLPLSNLAPATSIPSFGSTSAPSLLPLSNLAPANSIPSFGSTSASTPLPLYNLAPATSIPSFGSTSAPTPLPLSNLAPATSIPSFGSTSAPTPLPLSNLATSLLPSISTTPDLTQISAPASTTLASCASSISPLIVSTSVVTPTQAATSAVTAVSPSVARPTLPKDKSAYTTSRAEPNSSQTITKRHIRCEFIKLISKITVLDEELKQMCNRTVKGIHTNSLKFQESMKPLYDYCLLKNNDVAVEAN